jgi:hypothetical protein
MYIYHESIVNKPEDLITTTYGGKLHYAHDQIITVCCQKCNKTVQTKYGWHLKAKWFRENLPYNCRHCHKLKWIKAGHIAVTGRPHPNRGKTYEEIHGAEKGGLLRKQVARTGYKNAQFGRPAYTGSGNGWSGWYRDIYFRSLLELSFIVNFIEKNKLKYTSAEAYAYKIPYIDIEGNRRNYFADFLIDNVLIEIKPKLAATWHVNICKFTAAKKWCKKHGLKFKIYDQTMFDQLSKTQLISMYEDGTIRWIERYEKKFKKKYYEGEELC